MFKLLHISAITVIMQQMLTVSFINIVKFQGRFTNNWRKTQVRLSMRNFRKFGIILQTNWVCSDAKQSSFESVQFSLPQIEKSALCTFSSPSSKSRFIVAVCVLFSPVHCFVTNWSFDKMFYLIYRRDFKTTKMRKKYLFY